MKKIKAGIIGGAGYTGGELIRILLNHPACNLEFVQSRSSAGKMLHSIHQDLFGITDLKFCESYRDTAEVIFLCLGHGNSKKFLAENSIGDKIKIIDLSQDFRINTGKSHPFIYGLPELNRNTIKIAERIANPGCFATAIQMALLPLANAKLINGEVHVSAVTGATGAGQQFSRTSHFAWRDSNISVYKAFTHQHLNEIYQSLKTLQPEPEPLINFLPFRGNFTRGILAAVYLDSNASEDWARKIFQEFYSAHPFVHITDDSPSVKQVVNTNNCFLHLQKTGSKLLITSVIDNLVKGASGQAVQNMNLMFNLKETDGLILKASAF